VADSRLSRRTVTVKELVRLIIKSAVETGTPFAFNRDIVNRANPNSHKGMIYCSNLCTEIAQNMSPMETVSQTVETEDGDPVVVTRVRPGDFGEPFSGKYSFGGGWRVRGYRVDRSPGIGQCNWP